MRILILGKNYVSEKFCDLFQKNKDNIVFSIIENKPNYINFQDNNDILEFCRANELNLVIITNEEYIDTELCDMLNETGISILSPSKENYFLFSSKSYTKKFMHYNNIPIPKFAVHEKPSQAIEYISQTNTPQVISPDYKTAKENYYFCETMTNAKKIINNLFSSGNKRIVIEDYIDGKNIRVWVLSDGYKAKIIGTCAIYQDSIALFEPSFITDEIKVKIYNEAIIPTIDTLSDQNEEYIGIIGFDFIYSFDKQLFLTGYKSFFDDLCADFFVENFDVDWADVFYSCLVGDVFLKYQFNDKPKKHMLIFKQNNQINFISANTQTNLKRYLEETDCDINLYNEAQKTWKY